MQSLKTVILNRSSKIAQSFSSAARSSKSRMQLLSPFKLQSRGFAGGGPTGDGFYANMMRKVCGRNDAAAAVDDNDDESSILK